VLLKILKYDIVRDVAARGGEVAILPVPPRTREITFFWIKTWIAWVTLTGHSRRVCTRARSSSVTGSLPLKASLNGALSYSGERILETYYKYVIADGMHISLDYQFVDNPGYNFVRGPVSLFALHFHAEF
jgi:Carbohydrate-selective porin, OprB family